MLSLRRFLQILRQVANVLEMLRAETCYHAKGLLALDEFENALRMIARDPHVPKRAKDIALLGLQRGKDAKRENQE